MNTRSPLALAIGEVCRPVDALPVACDGAGAQCLGEIPAGEVATFDREEYCGPCALKYAAEELGKWRDPGFRPRPGDVRRAQDALDAITVELARVSARIDREGR
jgi:hypothetical protein